MISYSNPGLLIQSISAWMFKFTLVSIKYFVIDVTQIETCRITGMVVYEALKSAYSFKNASSALQMGTNINKIKFTFNFYGTNFVMDEEDITKPIFQANIKETPYITSLKLSMQGTTLSSIRDNSLFVNFNDMEETVNFIAKEFYYLFESSEEDSNEEKNQREREETSYKENLVFLTGFTKPHIFKFCGYLEIVVEMDNQESPFYAPNRLPTQPKSNKQIAADFMKYYTTQVYQANIFSYCNVLISHTLNRQYNIDYTKFLNSKGQTGFFNRLDKIKKNQEIEKYDMYLDKVNKMPLDLLDMYLDPLWDLPDDKRFEDMGILVKKLM